MDETRRSARSKFKAEQGKQSYYINLRSEEKAVQGRQAEESAEIPF